MRKLAILLTVLACLLAGCGTPPEPTEPPRPMPEVNPYTPDDFEYDGQRLKCLTGEALPGVDVSYYQGQIDWEAVAADGMKFAMIRVGYRGYVDGTIYPDENARANIEGALAAGLEVGVYFFSQALTPQEAAREAAFTVSFIEGCDITMPVVFDWEHVTDETARTAGMHDMDTLTDCAMAFMDVAAAAGYTPMVYFNRHQSQTLFDMSDLRDYPFWLALYDAPMSFPYRIAMWQYSAEGTVTGISTPVDLNLYFPE